MDQCHLYMSYGLYDKFDSLEERARSIVQILTSSTFESIDELRSTAVSMGVDAVIKGIPIGGDGSYTSERERVAAYQKTIYREYRENFYEYLKNNNVVVSERITNLVETCIKNEGEGLKLWIRKTGDKDTFILGGRFHSTSDRTETHVRAFTITPGDSCKIEGANPFAEGSKIKGGDTQEVLLRRTAPKKTITISVQTPVKEYWLTDQSIAPSDATEEFLFNPSEVEEGTSRGKYVKFNFLNTKRKSVRARINVKFNVARLFFDESNPTFRLKLEQVIDSKDVLIQSTAQLTFPSAMEEFTISGFVNAKANEIIYISANIWDHDRIDAAKCTATWKVEF